MKKLLLAALIFSALTAVYGQKKPAMVSIEKAIADAADELSSKVSVKTEIVIAAIKAPDSKVADFLTDELTAYLMRSGKFTVLQRGNALKAVDAEQEFQLSGMVSDKSAVGIGQYLGAKVVVTGTFDLYDGFNQLRLRAVDVRSSQLLAMPSSRVDPKDKVLAGVVPKAAKPQKIQEQTLDHLTRGKDLYREGKFDEAIREFDEAIRREPKNAQAYAERAGVYFYGKKDYNAAIGDYNEAIRLNGNNPEWYIDRAIAYYGLNDIDTAITSLTQGIRTIPNSAELYSYLGDFYTEKNDYDNALNNYNQAIRLNPNYLYAYYYRAYIYSSHFRNDDLAIADYTQIIRRAHKERDIFYLYDAYSSRAELYYERKKDYDKAIADYTEAIRIAANDKRQQRSEGVQHFSLGLFHSQLGKIYNAKGDNNRAVAEYENAIREYTEVIRLEPDDAMNYLTRGNAYYDIKDYNRAIADYETALKLDPKDEYGFYKNALESAQRKARGN